ncbi:TauD/TfdA dioxygenase family protein [Yinghuangia soli]|uniref:TauD/TfdA family dioxygenase n=1 Tax=Yinghuangia soli TaxID=2908204 RepID=A0AA41U1F7_9ACTN|nr:TauD/TfdA family dioxygenase [Yinghuangia soli]MCF2526094.1 TauD/TfdA family dioxygenase [Yinghuangia soli]
MLDVRPLTPAIGAEVHGLDLRGGLDAATYAALTDALHTHQVLFFRDQDITAHQQRDFAAGFGVLQHFPFGRPAAPDLPEVMVLPTDGSGPKVSNADTWHSDATFLARPPMGTILRAVTLPALGGDTLWADMESAYQALSAPLREMLDGLTAEHDFTKSRAHRGGDKDALPPSVHPVVRTHPATGRRCLYVNRVFTTRIVELDARENELILPYLFEHVARPEFQVRFRWRAGDVAFWDNRSTQHYAAYDYAGPRVMHRIVIEGDEPR